ncbi:MAG: PPC domain-containing DNA-binding protein [Candidatus Heimdallarchaeaceae archaeon]
MKAQKSSVTRIHFIKLEPGDDILASITEYCRNNIQNSGVIIGIGAVRQAHLGYFDIEQKTYLSQKFDINAELVQCAGNVSRNAETGEIIVHLHMAIGDSKFQLIGGHVLEGNIISVTGEFFIFETELPIKRQLNQQFNLWLWDF